jgi:uncharacterized membrane protein
MRCDGLSRSVAGMKFALQIVLALVMVAMGILHFAAPKAFVRTMPRMLPAPLFLVLLSGVFEILGGVGLMVPRTQRFAAWGLMALYVAVFPANVNMAVNQIGFGSGTPQWVLWARLPLQLVLIAWAYWYT